MGRKMITPYFLCPTCAQHDPRSQRRLLYDDMDIYQPEHIRDGYKLFVRCEGCRNMTPGYAVRVVLDFTSD